MTRDGILLVAAAAALRLAIAPSYGYLQVDGDLFEHKQAVHRALTQGVHTVYLENARHDPALTGREWDGGYFMNNLPVIVYVRSALGALYRWASPGSLERWGWQENYFDLLRTDLQERLAATRGLTVLLKLPGIAAEVWITWFVWRAARRRGRAWAVIAGGALALNPGLIADTAFFGQHDALAAALVIGSLVLLDRGAVAAGVALYTVAAMTKPQASAFALLVMAMAVHQAWRRERPGRVLATAAVCASAVLGVIWAPFLWHGTFATSVAAVWHSTVGGEPYLSCNAANLWWLLSGGRGYETRDTALVLGPLTARMAGLLASLTLGVAVVARTVRRGEPGGPPWLSAAVLGMGFFLLSTELHENHMMAVLPLLALAAVERPRLALALGLVSATFFANLLLFDGPSLGSLGLVHLPVRAISLIVASVNLAAFGLMVHELFAAEPPVARPGA